MAIETVQFGYLPSLTVLEAAELSKLLEEKWGVYVKGSDRPKTPPQDYPAVLSIILVNSGDKRVNVIKEVRVIRSDLALKEVKDLVENAPVVVQETGSLEEAAAIGSRLKRAGAEVIVLTSEEPSHSDAMVFHLVNELFKQSIDRLGKPADHVDYIKSKVSGWDHASAI